MIRADTIRAIADKVINEHWLDKTDEKQVYVILWGDSNGDFWAELTQFAPTSAKDSKRGKLVGVDNATAGQTIFDTVE